MTQNYVSARVRVRDKDGIGFLTRLGLLAALLAGLLILAGVGWYSGWPQQKAKEFQSYLLDLTKDADFAVKDIVVEGRRQSSKADILDALGVKQGTPILGIDLDEAAARIEKLTWIEKVAVERRLPDTIAVTLTEHIPMARWQHNEKVSVIDTRGRLLPSVKPDDFSSLPMIVGTGADREAGKFLNSLKAYPEIGNMMQSAVRVSERRWDLRLPPRVTVRLPEDDVDNALRRLSVLISEEKILSRNIVAIDLRIPDRLVVEPAVGETKATDKKPNAKKSESKKTGDKKKP
ncbi:MAG: FtsQ-type POTRA domain-containing protein [Bdellovibrionales bacterium]